MKILWRFLMHENLKMVAASDCDGRLTPIWFRFEAEDHRIDEAWAILDGFEALYGRGQMVSFAHFLKDEIEAKMWPLPVSELFLVGRATTKKLHSLGIKTIGELADADEQMIKAHLKKPGLLVQGNARGEDLEPYMFTHETNKGCGQAVQFV